MRVTMLAMLVAAWLPGPAAAAGPAPEALPATVSRADEQAVRRLVQAQLDAFAADDAVAAFGFASPAIRRQFGDAAHFMSVVRQGYPVVYRPAEVVFMKPERRADLVVQGVRMTDADGRAWFATYQVERQADGGWRIGGCVVVPNRSVGA